MLKIPGRQRFPPGEGILFGIEKDPVLSGDDLPTQPGGGPGQNIELDDEVVGSGQQILIQQLQRLPLEHQRDLRVLILPAVDDRPNLPDEVQPLDDADPEGYTLVGR